MKINPKFIFPVLIMVMLISCSANVPSLQPTSTNHFNSATPTIFPSETLFITKTLTPRPSRPSTSTRIPTETVIIPAYSTKQVILEYTVIGAGLGSPREFLAIFFGEYPAWTRFVLYSDNQFILQEGYKPIRTKILTTGEKDRLFSELDRRGFYSIDTSQTSDETNPMYDFKGRYNEVEVTDGGEACLFASLPTPKKVCIYEPYREFLIPTIKALFQFMDDYNPGNLSVYRPNRLLLFVSKGRQFYNSYEYFVTPSIASARWPVDLPPLATATEKYIYLEGENVVKVLSLVKNAADLMVFSENGEEYSVFVDVVLPHENLIQP